MTSIKQKFEKDLLVRISQRIASHESVEKSMLHTLRYYDLLNKGAADFKQFQQFVGKYGMQVYENDQLQQIFESYDLENEGAIHHKVLIARILGRPEPTSESQLADSRLSGSNIRSSSSKFEQHSTITKDKMEIAVDVLSFKLKRRGFSSILELAAECVAADRSTHHEITSQDLEYILNCLKVDLTKDELEAVAKYFQSAKGNINYTLLLSDLTAGFSTYRAGIVRESFDRLDYTEKGQFDLRMLKELFNPRNHPEVRSGRKTSDEVTSEFYGAINAYIDSQKGSSLIKIEGYIDFWKQLSPHIDSDLVFEGILKNSFRFNELPRKNKLEAPSPSFQQNNLPVYDNERTHPTDSIKYTIYPNSDKNVSKNYIFAIFDHMKKQLSKRGPKGLMQLYRTFKCNDYDGDGRLSCKEFTKSLHEMRVELLEKETINIFKVFDSQQSGFVNISEFMSSFIPELNEKRASGVQSLLDMLSGNSDVISYKALKKSYYPRGHPDFLSNKRADYHIREEFFGILDSFLTLTGGINDEISRDLLLQFFEIYSFAYEDDALFTMIISGTFRLAKLNYPPTVQFGVPSHSYSEKSYSVKSRTTSSIQNPPFGIDRPSEPKSPKSTISNISAASQHRRDNAFRSPVQSSKRAEIEISPDVEIVAPEDAFKRKKEEVLVNNFMGAPSTNSQIRNKIITPPDSPGARPLHPGLDSVVNEIRSQIRNAPRGLFGLERLFVLADEARLRTISAKVLAQAFSDYELDVRPEEIQTIFKHTSEDGGKTINYLNLLSDIRGQMNEYREKPVTALFRRIDRNNSEMISTDDLVNAFRPENHNDVITRKTTADEIFDELVDKFDLFGRLGGYDFNNRIIRYDEYLEFFDGISVLEIDDDAFVDFVRNCFP